MREVCALLLEITPIPFVCGCLVSWFVLIFWKTLWVSVHSLWQDKTPQQEGMMEVVWSLLSIFLSSCLFVFLSVTHVCLSVCIREGGKTSVELEKKFGWKYCGQYCIVVEVLEVLWPEVITPVTSCAPRQHPSLLPHPPQHIHNSEFALLLQQAWFEFLTIFRCLHHIFVIPDSLSHVCIFWTWNNIKHYI